MLKKSIQIAVVAFLCVTLSFSCKKETMPTQESISGLETANLLSPQEERVVVNGQVLGFGVANYKAPVLENNNLMVQGNVLLERLGYTISYNSDKTELTATRKTTNTVGINTLVFKNKIKLATADNKQFELGIAPYIKDSELFIPARFAAEKAGAAIIQWDTDTESLQLYYYEECDWGVYFYGTERDGSSDAVGAQKWVAGQPNRFFDPSKPTIIYTHGWQLDGVKNKGREDFRFTGNGVDVQTHNFWIETGWNVGIFHWVQFADDGGIPPPREAEAKIYDPQNGLTGMVWKKTDGNKVSTNPITKNVMQLYADAYEGIFGTNYTGNEIRLMGNSLGGNLTMALLMELHQRNTPKKPQRVTLIDPYWSLNLGSSQATFPYNYTDAFALCADAGRIYRDNYNTAIEYFRTSLAGAAGTNEELIKYTAFSHFGTDYSWNTITKHTAPVRQYFWSRKYSAPIEWWRPNTTQGLVPTGNVAANANTSNARIREMMVDSLYWNHIDGRATITPGDDAFELREGLY